MIRRWTPEEDRIARDMRDRGKTCGQIALRLGRSHHAVHSRLRDFLGGTRKPEGITDHDGVPLERIAA